MTDEDKIYHPVPERLRNALKPALTARELEQIKALCLSLRGRKRRPVDGPHVSEKS